MLPQFEDSMSFTNLVKFSAIIALNVSQLPFVLFSPHGTPVTSMLDS